MNVYVLIGSEDDFWFNVRVRSTFGEVLHLTGPNDNCGKKLIPITRRTLPLGLILDRSNDCLPSIGLPTGD
jgi:hypothetical protein